MIELRNIQSDYAEYWNSHCKQIESGDLLHENFVIIVDSANISELQYFALMLDSIKRTNQKFTCSVRIKHVLDNSCPENISIKDGDRARISTLLSGVVHELGIVKDFYFEKNTPSGFTYSGIQETVLGRLFPFISVNSDIYLFLRSSVAEKFTNALDKNGSHFVSVYNVEKNKVTINTTFYNASDEIKRIYNACLRYLFGEVSEPQSRDFQQYFSYRIAHYTSKEFFEQVKNINILSFLIFCLQKRTQLLESIAMVKEKQTTGRKKFTKVFLRPEGIPREEHLFFDSQEEFDKAIEDDDYISLVNAMDMGDGLLQLIENIVFHAGDTGKNNGRGMLSLRINKRGTESWDSYLETEYHNYFCGHNNRLDTSLNFEGRADWSSFEISKRESSTTSNISSDDLTTIYTNRTKIVQRLKKRKRGTYYLEVRVIDHSDHDMCSVFKNNLERRGDPSFKTLNIKVSTFFNPNAQESDEWKAYTSRPDNVVNHYGLELFDALLRSLDACFVVQSTDEEKEIDIKTNLYSTSGDGIDKLSTASACFSGTQYAILLPFGRNVERSNTFANVAINYNLSHVSFSQQFWDDKEFYRLLNEGFKSQEEKETKITDLYKMLPSIDETTILNVNLTNVLPISYEILAKALFLFVAKHSEKKIHIALKNCNNSAFLMLIREFALLYDRNGENEYFSKAQIYILGDGANSEFLLAGVNIKNTVVAQMKLEASKGIQGSAIVNFLKTMLSMRPGKGQYNSINYVPFELLIRDKATNTTVFENNVNRILNSDVHEDQLGCLLKPNHMRLGSKIHTDRFYEAMMLFSKSDYTRGFSWLLKSRIEKLVNDGEINDCSQEAPYLFIGYESYSEMLLRDLIKYYSHADYCIFTYSTLNSENKMSKDDTADNETAKSEISKGDFNHLKGLKDGVSYTPIFVVPINSTLSTFDKLEEEAKQKLSTKINNKKATYIGVIQTRHGTSDVVTQEEEPYFEQPVDINAKTIVSKLLGGNKVHYMFSLKAMWFNPIQCEICYPPCSFAEQPLIETDKTSVVPAQLFGATNKKCIKVPRESGQNQKITDDLSKRKDERKSNEFKGMVDDLKNHVVFGHHSRGSNHFEYYIRDDDLFETFYHQDGANSKLVKWLKSVKEDVCKADVSISEHICYDIIVCPDHFSNKGFVMAVNEHVFDGAALIISVDAESEFRDNFITKHSDLKNLCNILVRQERPAEINFYFVDDIIIHGTSFFRVKSLIRSLFNDKTLSNAHVKIRLFKSIFLLIDRNSPSSRLKYIDALNNYYAYLTLHISSQRTHGDACTLCQEKNEMDILSRRSSLKSTSLHFEEKCKSMEAREVLRYQSETPQMEETEENKNFMAMKAKHILYLEFEEFAEQKNDTSTVFEVLCKAIVKYSETAFEEIISYIVACSSPFLSFRKSNKEAILALINVIFEVVLSDGNVDAIIGRLLKNLEAVKYLTEDEHNETLEARKQMLNNASLKTLLNRIVIILQNPVQKRELIETLMRQSAALKSSFIIRKENIIRLITFAHISNFGEEFLADYLYNIKKLISGGSDEAKALFIEYLILSGSETIANASYNKDSIFDVNPWESNAIDELIKESLNKQDEDVAILISGIKSQLIEFMRDIYLENTQVIYDATIDLIKHKGNLAKYFLSNYEQIISWNGDRLDDVSKCLVKVWSELNDNEAPNEQTERPETLKKFEKIAKAISALAEEVVYQPVRDVVPNTDSRVDVYFLSSRNENTLRWNKESDGSVFSEDTHPLDCFAKSYADREEDAQQVSSDVEPLLNGHHLENNTYFYIDELRILIIKLESSMTERPICLALRFKSNNKKMLVYKILRYILTFRNKLEELVDQYFDDEQLSQVLEKRFLERQLHKARAAFHSSDDAEKMKDNNASYYPDRCLLSGDPPINDDDAERSAFKQYINAIIGKVNIQLLLGNNIWSYTDINADAMANDEEILQEFCNILSSICYLPRWELLEIDDMEDIDDKDHLCPEIVRPALRSYFESLFSRKTLQRNHQGFPPFRYIVAFVAEILNGAARDGIVPTKNLLQCNTITFSCEQQYLVIKNKIRISELTTDDKCRRKIAEGLLRETDGVSLATTCGFFDAFYLKEETRRVIIIVKENSFTIKLPIFER